MTVLTLGTFDIPHYGHLRFLKKCSEFGFVTVGLNTDEFIEKYKGKKPVMTYEERENTLNEWGFWSVTPNDQPDGTIKDVIEASKPRLLIIGSDWLRKEYLKQVGLDPDYLDERNISLVYVPYTWSISSTEIKKRISES